MADTREHFAQKYMLVAFTNQLKNVSHDCYASSLNNASNGTTTQDDSGFQELNATAPTNHFNITIRVFYKNITLLKKNINKPTQSFTLTKRHIIGLIRIIALAKNAYVHRPHA